jgi:hypothetical protein
MTPSLNMPDRGLPASRTPAQRSLPPPSSPINLMSHRDTLVTDKLSKELVVPAVHALVHPYVVAAYPHPAAVSNSAARCPEEHPIQQTAEPDPPL